MGKRQRPGFNCEPYIIVPGAGKTGIAPTLCVSLGMNNQSQMLQGRSRFTTVRILVAEYQLVAKSLDWIVRFKIPKYLLERLFLECVDAQNLQNVVEASVGL